MTTPSTNNTDQTPESQTAQLQQAVAVLTQQLALLRAQAALADARKTQDELSAKALLDALKEQTASQTALDTAKAQGLFAELQGIKAGVAGLTLPTGKEGTVTVAAGTAGTALLRSKLPILRLLDEVAEQLATKCLGGAVVLTEEQLGKAKAAAFTLKRIDDETNNLAESAKKATPKDPAAERVILESAAAPIVAGLYGLGFTLDTINSLIKLLRSDRKLDIFSSDAEAGELLGYLLESKNKGIIAKPELLGDKAMSAAESLLGKLRDLGTEVQVANDTLARIKKYAEDIAKAPADDPIKKVVMPDDETVSRLKADVDQATSLLNGIHPAEKPDAFWAQVTGQVIAGLIAGRRRLFVEAKAQAVQVTESRWYQSNRILTTGEVQVAYRILDAEDSVVEAGVILKASKAGDSRIDTLAEVTWPEPE